MKQSNGKYTALYVRVARTANTAFLSQTQLLMSYAEEQGYKNFVIFGDNGFSGTSLSRPAYLGLLSEIHNGNIERVIVKCIDRIARNHNLVDDFLDLCEVCKVKHHSLDKSIGTYLHGDDLVSNLVKKFFEEYQSSKESGVQAYETV